MSHQPPNSGPQGEEQPAECWLEALRAFPSEGARPAPAVDAAVLLMAKGRFAQIRNSRHRRMSWMPASAAACVAAGLTWLIMYGLKPAQPAIASDRDYSVILKEVSALFPQQVNAIIANGPELEISLADEPVVGERRAVLLEFCYQNDVTVVITYIGSTVEVGSRRITVRTDTDGIILIEGPDFKGSVGNQIRLSPDMLMKSKCI